MKFTTLLLQSFLCLTALSAQAQTSKSIDEDIENSVTFTKAEVDAKFPGGEEAWKEYIKNNIDLKKPVLYGASAGTYIIKLRFIVHKDGTISDISPETFVGYGMENQAIELLKKGPKWIPAMQNAYRVNIYKHQQITFIITEEK